MNEEAPNFEFHPETSTFYKDGKPITIPPEGLRDWFTGLAMASIKSTVPVSPTEIASRAYEQADAMMKARGFTPH